MDLDLPNSYFDGISVNRLNRDYQEEFNLEKIFHDEWKLFNQRKFRTPTLMYLLDPENNYNPQIPNERDAKIFATAIQWLGTHCGQLFLEQVKNKAQIF